MDSTPNNGKLLFDVGGTFLKAVIADGNGRFVPDTEYSVPMPSDGPREEIEQALIAAVERGMRSAADRGLRIGCTGIAFPGPFDFGLGIPLMTHKFRNIYGISLLDLLRTRTDVGPTMPVLFMHDVNAAMLGEMRCGNARGFANAALIALGTGLGFACCLDGEGELALGNLFRQELEDILRGERAAAIHAGFDARRPVEALCRRCGYAERFTRG